MLLPLLFGDDTRVRLLQVLSTHQSGATQRDLARRLGRSASHVNKIVHEFQAAGVVQVDPDRRVRLDPESPLHDAIVEALERFEEIGRRGQLLRTVLRPAKERFGDRFYVGGYLAATRYVEPIDFRSDRCDLYVKGLLPKDEEWKKGLQKATTFDVRLHETQHLTGLSKSAVFEKTYENETVDDVACLIAYPEVGALQCLSYPDFPRYGAFLILVQGIAEWLAGSDAGFQPQRFTSGAVKTPWSTGELRRIVDHIEDALRHPGAAPPKEILGPTDLRELKNALDTVRGG